MRLPKGYKMRPKPYMNLVPMTSSYLGSLKPNYLNKGYNVPKWIKFCETMINNGWEVFLHRAKTTVSKYVVIHKGNKKYKIRFSNHRANYGMESSGDADYYVGVGNFGCITTEELIDRLLKEN